MYAEVKTLSPAVLGALKSAGYARGDIEIIPAVEVDSYGGGSQGRRAFVVVVNLDTGKFESVRGSWGGENMFVQNPVDSGGEKIPIPANGAVIKGSSGYGVTYATLYAHPDGMGRFLGSGDTVETTDAEQWALYAHTDIKGGEYRREELRRHNVSPATIDRLVERGLLKRNKAGATQVTTAGRNARDRSRAR